MSYKYIGTNLPLEDQLEMRRACRRIWSYKKKLVVFLWILAEKCHVSVDFYLKLHIHTEHLFSLQQIRFEIPNGERCVNTLSNKDSLI